ncbi:MAG: heavy-metal-associated domain protein [Herbinix sp.]|jgi:copper chaperone CopZ|nr:heavy-metal-associated domain protein [Herbinix sp.]
MNTVHYQVNGLVNTPMKTQVKNALEKVDGVQKVNIDLHRGSVEVDYNDPAKESEIRTEIEHVGCRIV